ncbi:hypothetical protein M9458_048626, partial [Cirrhinus mrigala]
VLPPSAVIPVMTAVILCVWAAHYLSTPDPLEATPSTPDPPEVVASNPDPPEPSGLSCYNQKFFRELPAYIVMPTEATLEPPAYPVMAFPKLSCPVTAMETIPAPSACEAIPEVSACPVTAMEPIFERSAFSVMTKEAVSALSFPCHSQAGHS